MERKILWLISIIIILSMILGGCKSFFKKDKVEVKEEDEIIPVEIEKVGFGRIYEELSFAGRVFSEKDNVIIPNIPGNVKRVEVEVGDEVEAGDLLFVVENEEIEKNLETIEEALKELEKQKARLDEKVNSLGNMPSRGGIDNKSNIPENKMPVETPEDNASKESPRDLPVEEIPNELPTDVEIEMPEIDVSIDRINKIIEDIEKMPSLYERGVIEEVKAAEKELNAKIGELQMAKKQAETAYEKLEVKSPGKGTVSYIGIHEGGIALNTEPSILVSNLEKMYIEINVTDRIVNKINKEATVSVGIPAVSGEELKGTIELISISPDLKNGLYPIRILIESGDNQLKPGMVGKAKIRFNEKEDVIVVKNDVVLDKNNNKIIYIEKDGKAVERKVSIGLDTGEKVEITSGLKKGDRLIVKGQNFLRNDSEVKVIGGGK
ncbi:MAG TPA: efflux RND transporter periplasmic adaptor subunit [Tissierellales bacterium]|nr:efflux RND transporter periplasmic adaptor subunit [Tissierellales bacterium]